MKVGISIKIIADIPGPSQETMNAIVSAAHTDTDTDDGKTLQVVVHAATLKPFQMAINSKTDYITHYPVHGVVTDEMVKEMVESKQVIIPTLVMMEASAKPNIRSISKIFI